MEGQLATRMQSPNMEGEGLEFFQSKEILRKGLCRGLGPDTPSEKIQFQHLLLKVKHLNLN